MLGSWSGLGLGTKTSISFSDHIRVTNQNIYIWAPHKLLTLEKFKARWLKEERRRQSPVDIADHPVLHLPPFNEQDATQRTPRLQLPWGRCSFLQPEDLSHWIIQVGFTDWDSGLFPYIKTIPINFNTDSLFRGPVEWLFSLGRLVFTVSHIK